MMANNFNWLCRKRFPSFRLASRKHCSMPKITGRITSPLKGEGSVAQARGRRFQVEARAAYGLNNNGLVLSDVYNNPTEQQQFSLGFSVPVLDWGRNKAMMRTAMAEKQ